MKNLKVIFKSISLIVCCLILLSSCKKQTISNSAIDSFLPMQVGNYWGAVDRKNYTEIQDTVRINGQLYYKFFSLIGGDGASTSYLRIDEQNRLVESYPENPLRIYVRADFSAKVGDVFYTLGDKTVNDYKVTVTEKSDTEMTFDYEMIYHPNLKGQVRTEKYIKGRGWAFNFELIIINGKGYRK